MMDITERKKAESALKESEEKLRHILSSSVDDFYVIDLDYQVILINQTAQRNLELAWGKKVTSGALILDLLPPERKDYIKNNYDLVFKGEKINYDYPVPFPGGVLWKNVEYGPVRNEEGVITGAFVTSVDITVKKNAEEELLESYRAIRELSGHLQNIREEERSNIAREIHDELGQQLTVLKMDISWLMGKWQGKDEKVAERLSGLLEMIDNTVKSVRRISSELRPSMLDDLGLSAAIEWHTQDFGKRMGIGIRTMVETGEVKLPERVNISLFRVLQECLTNVARHAKATEITVRLYQQDDHMNLEIQDNGVGFLKAEVTNKKTLGILGMKERIALIKGNYSIDSILGKGTLVRVSVPVSPTT
ncbi:MAG: PAS domain-containing sensor histidine kinase [Chitinophagaceae bacterium]